MVVVETNRLQLRYAVLQDDAFFFELMNQPSWIRFIGDRNIRTLVDAQKYISEKLINSYTTHGFGLYVTVLKSENKPIGLCGLVKRDTLKDVDIGFAFLPQFTRQGYAFESASAIMDYAKNILNIPRIVAITTPDNVRSGKLLERLGFRFDSMIRFEPDDKESKLYVPGKLERCN